MMARVYTILFPIFEIQSGRDCAFYILVWAIFLPLPTLMTWLLTGRPSVRLPWVIAITAMGALNCFTGKHSLLPVIVFYLLNRLPWDDWFRKLGKKSKALLASMTAVAQAALRRQISTAFS